MLYKLSNGVKTEVIGSCKVNASITIPDTVTTVGFSAFENNPNVNVVRFAGSPSISPFAFAGCSNMSEVYFYSLQVPQIGVSAFQGDSFTAYVPYNSQGGYEQALSGYNATISLISVDATLMIEEEVYEEITVYYGATITELGEPMIIGVEFDGWYDNPEFTGVLYENGAIWLITDDITLYSKWNAIAPE